MWAWHDARSMGTHMHLHMHGVHAYTAEPDCACGLSFASLRGMDRCLTERKLWRHAAVLIRHYKLLWTGPRQARPP